MNFIEELVDFFQILFGGNAKEVQTKKELKAIFNELRSFKPALMQQKPKAMLPGIGQIFFEFFRVLSPLADILGKTIGNPDPAIRKNSRNFVLETQMEHTQREKLESFQYENLKNRLLVSDTPEKDILKIREDFQAFYNNLFLRDKNRIKIEMTELDRLWSLCTFDFENFLSLFDVHFNFTNPNYKPKFTMATSPKIGEGLKDFYFIWAGFKPEVNLYANLCALLERLGIDDAENEKKIQTLIKHIQRLYMKVLPPKILLYLIRAIEGDPYLSPEIGTTGKEEVQDYIENLQQYFNRDIDRITMKRSENSIAGEMKELFGSTPLQEVDSYNQKLNELLQSNQLTPITHYKALQILKSFTRVYFDGKIRDPLNMVMVEAFFEKKAFQTSLSETYYACERISGELVQFEETLKGKGRYSIVLLNTKIKELKQGSQNQDIINRIVTSINKRAQEVIEEKSKLYHRLAIHLQEIINDFKKPTPDIISNIKGIGGHRNKELISTLVEGYNALARYLKIVRHFVVLIEKLDQ